MNQLIKFYAMREIYMKKQLHKTHRNSWRLMSVMLLMLLGLGGFMRAQIWELTYCSNMPAATQSNAYGPMYSTSTANATSRTASIYPASQLAGITGQILTSIYFHTGVGNANGMTGSPNFKVYLKEVSNTDWGSAALDWSTAVAGATLVYDGDPSSAIGTGGGWKQFSFTNNFTYTGTQNLAILMEYHNSSASNSISWSYEYTAPCISTTGTGTKYSNVTTGVLPTSLTNTNYRRPYVAFDFVVSCPAPSPATISSITPYGMSASWTPGGSETTWEYAVVPSGSGVPTTFSTTNTPNVDFTTLTPATEYDFYVRANCGATDGESVWKGPYKFTTGCVAVDTLFEDFNSTPTGTVFPPCFVRLNPGTGTLSVNSTTPFSTPNNVYQYAATSTQSSYLILPELTNVHLGTHRLRFRARTSSTTGTPQLKIGYITDVADASTFVELEVIDVLNTTYTVAESEKIVIPMGVPQGARLAISNPNDSKGYYYDDIHWEAIPTCFPPTDLDVTLITHNTAQASWVAPTSGTPTSYDVYYSTSNTAPDATTTPSFTGLTSTIQDLTGLTPNTTYYVWVRSVCSATDVSYWSSYKTFTTQCAPYVPSYINDFATFPGACWKNLKGGDPASGLAPTANGSWADDGFLNNGTTGSARINLYTLGKNDWLISPVFDLSAGGYRVKFDYGITAYTGTAEHVMGTDDYVQVVYSTDGGTTWSAPLVQWDNSNSPSNSNNTFIYDLSSLTSNSVIFAIFASEGTVDDPGDYNFYIDNFIVEEVPSCPEPSLVTFTNITDASFTIDWTAPANAPANGYDVYYSTSNTAPTATTTPTLTSATTTINVTGLSSNTTYYVWVRSNCAVETSPWTSMSTVKTACGLMTTMFEGFETTTTGNFVPDCWVRLAPSTSAGSQTVSTSTPATGARNIYQYASSSQNPVYVILPQFSNIADGTHRLRFKARVSTSGGTLNVGYVTDVTDASTFVLLEPLAIANTAYTAAGSEYIVNVPIGTPANARLAIANTADGKSYYWDDVYWEKTPTCFDPTDVTFANITATTANVSWIPPTQGAPVSYDVYYSTSDVVPSDTATPTLTGITANTVDLTSLQSSTRYYVWVRSNCGGTLGTSIWTLVKSFSTLCDPPVLTVGVDQTVCMNGTATLTGSSTTAGAEIKWYDAPVDGNLVGTGTSFVTPALTTSTTYYAAASTGSSAYVGVATPQALGSPGTTTAGTTFYMEVTIVNAPVTIQTVDVFPLAANESSTIKIYSGTTTPALYEFPFVSNVASAGVTPQTIPLNVTLDPGVYRFKIEGSGSYYRNWLSPGGVGATFPYTNGNFSLTGGSNATTGYYLFYNFLIGASCESARQPVMVTVDPSCSVSGTIEVGTKSSATVYPNPFTDAINISDIKNVQSVSVMDASGRLVKTIKDVQGSIYLGDLKQGMYILNVHYKNGNKASHKIIKK